MDGLLNKAKGLLNKSGGSSSGNSNPANPQDPNAPNTNAGASSGQQDYGDKALDFIEKKTGHSLSAEQNEKITDGARGFYESHTGKKVDSKWSN